MWWSSSFKIFSLSVGVYGCRFSFFLFPLFLSLLLLATSEKYTKLRAALKHQSCVLDRFETLLVHQVWLFIWLCEANLIVLCVFGSTTMSFPLKWLIQLVLVERVVEKLFQCAFWDGGTCFVISFAERWEVLVLILLRCFYWHTAHLIWAPCLFVADYAVDVLKLAQSIFQLVVVVELLFELLLGRQLLFKHLLPSAEFRKRLCLRIWWAFEVKKERIRLGTWKLSQVILAPLLTLGAQYRWEVLSQLLELVGAAVH